MPDLPPTLPFSPRELAERTSRLRRIEQVLFIILLAVPGAMMAVLGSIGLRLHYEHSVDLGPTNSLVAWAIVIGGIILLAISGTMLFRLLRSSSRAPDMTADTLDDHANPRH